METGRQKRMAIINDLACYGRCAIAVAQPIISAMGIESCPLPTAVLSTNGAFRGCVATDMADFMGETIAHWNELGIMFDGICSGFYTSKEQIEHAKHLFERIKTKEKTNHVDNSYSDADSTGNSNSDSSQASSSQTLIFVDPIMGDNGKRYSVTKDEVCEGYRSLLSYADVLTPNLTECCELLDISYPKTVPDQSELEKMAQALCAMGPKKIVITGIDRGDAFENFIYEDGECQSVMAKKIGDSRSGTGDVFMAVLAGAMVRGDSFTQAVKKAVEFLNIAITRTVERNISPRNGVCFEECLSFLIS